MIRRRYPTSIRTKSAILVSRARLFCNFAQDDSEPRSTYMCGSGMVNSLRFFSTPFNRADRLTDVYCSRDRYRLKRQYEYEYVTSSQCEQNSCDGNFFSPCMDLMREIALAATWLLFCFECSPRINTWYVLTRIRLHLSEEFWSIDVNVWCYHGRVTHRNRVFSTCT